MTLVDIILYKNLSNASMVFPYLPLFSNTVFRAGYLLCMHKFRAGHNVHGVKRKNHGTQDFHVVPHHGTNWAAL